MTSLTHLSLTHFRNYRELELDFEKRLTLLSGNNAQGKTNLLEAIFLLATSKPIHATMEREVVDWSAGDEPIPYCRVGARIISHQGEKQRQQELEVLYTPRADGINFTKQVKINGVTKRSMDLVGLLRTVLFLPEDIKLVDGSPSERRRYMDVALCQIDPVYCRTLSSYQKIVTQRNSLLKSLREQSIAPSSTEVDAQLGYWDKQLVRHGVYLLDKRIRYTEQLDELARFRHADLTEQRERLEIHYLPSFNVMGVNEAQYQEWKKEASGTVPVPMQQDAPTAGQIEERYSDRLRERRSREVAAGVTLYGPHRDDLRFMADGRDLRTYGSRGQQRSAALSLKLAEVQAMTEETGAAPVLLLDDVMSELDAHRRSTLLTALSDVEQAIVTTTDWEDFTPEFRAAADCLTVRNGTVSAVDSAVVSKADNDPGNDV